MWRRRCGAKRRFGVRTGVAASASKRRTLRVRSIRICLSCLFSLLSIRVRGRDARSASVQNRGIRESCVASRPAGVRVAEPRGASMAPSFFPTHSLACPPPSFSLPPFLSHSLSPSPPFFRTLTHSLAHSVAFSLVFAPVHSLLSFSPADAFCFFSLAHSFAFFPFSHTHAYIYTHRAYTSFLSFSLPFDRLLSFSVRLPSRLTYRLRLSRLSGQRPFHDILAPSALLFHSTLLRRATSCHLRAPV